MRLKNINKSKVHKCEDGQKLNYGALASGIGSLGAMAINVATMDDPKPSKAASTANGAMSGMAAGSAFGPIGMGVGALTGGALGLWQGNKEEEAYKAEQKKKEELAATQRTMAFNQSSQANLASANNRGFSSSGTQQSSFYGENGGTLKSIKSLKGGELQPISNNTKLAVGQSHENGGIKLDAKSEIEGGETLVDKGDHTLVVSDNLINPMSGNTFAKDDLKLAKSLSKFEGKTSNLAKNSIKQIYAKREILHDMQQKMNGDATDNETLEARDGMKINNIGVAGQGNTSEDITNKADIPIAGNTTPVKKVAKPVRKLNMLSKPIKSPVPVRTQVSNYAKNGMKMYKKGGDYYGEYKSKGETDLGGGYKVRKGVNGKIEYSKDNGKTYTRPTKEVYTKLNNTAFNGRLGSYSEDKVNNTPVDFNTVGRKDNTAIPSVNASPMSNVDVLSAKHGPNATAWSGQGIRVKYDQVEDTSELAKESRDYTSLNKGLGSLAKLGTYVAPHVLDYANERKNIARLKNINIPDAPQQGFVNLAKQNMEVDRADIRKQQANYNAGLSGTLADSQTAALMKANIAEKSANALAGVNQAQRNANIQTANQQTELNMGIDARNKAGIYGQKQQQMEKDVDISNRTAGTTSNLLSGFRDVQNTYRQEGFADKQFDIDYAGLDPRGREYMDKLKATGTNYNKNRVFKKGGKLNKLSK